MSHTPGPWHVKECGEAECWCRVIVAEVPDAEDDPTVIPAGALREHNAAIVAAAPDLLEALQAVMREPLIYTGAIEETLPVSGMHIDLVAKIEAAIAKATA